MKMMTTILASVAALSLVGGVSASTIDPNETAVGPNVSLSTFMAAQIQPWVYPPAGGPPDPPVYAMEFVPLLPNVYDNSPYDPSHTDCLTGCNANLYGDWYGPPTAGLVMMVARFKNPVDYVSVNMSSGYGWIQAFNLQNQLIGYCEGWLSRCFSSSGSDPQYTLWGDISTLAVSGYQGLSQVNSISYGVPEPAEMGLLLLGLIGLVITRAWRLP
jgi:hypothetical protein